MKNSILIALIGSLCFASCQSIDSHIDPAHIPQIADSLYTQDMKIKAPSAIKYLIVENSWTMREYTNSEGYFSIPQSQLQVAGVYTWTFMDRHHQTLSTQHSYVRSGTPAIKLETYLSYPYIVAGTSEISETVVIPTDLHGNLLDEAQKAEIFFQTEKSSASSIENSSYNFSTVTLKSQKTAMLIPFTIRTHQSYSKNQLLHIEAGKPHSLQLTVSSHSRFSDAQQSIFIQGEDILDQYGNPCEDGTRIDIRMSDGPKISDIQGIIINGQFQSEIIAPHTSRKVEFVAISEGIEISNKAAIKFREFQILHQNQSIVNAIRFTFFSEQMAQIIEDGTHVDFHFYGTRDTIHVQRQTEHGSILIDRGIYHLIESQYDYEIDILHQKLKGQIHP